MILTFAPASCEDAESIYLLNKQLIDQYEDLSSIDYHAVLQWVRQNVKKTIPFFTRVLCSGELAGYYALIPVGDTWELDSLFVLPEFQNQGIGTAILRRCMDASPALSLYVFRRNEGALRLYQRMGFTITKEVGKTRYLMEYQKQDC